MNTLNSWQEIRKARKERKKEYHEKFLPRDFEALDKSGFKFEEKSPHHFVIDFVNCRADWWPGTGKWIVRGTKETGIGLKRLFALKGKS